MNEPVTVTSSICSSAANSGVLITTAQHGANENSASDIALDNVDEAVDRGIDGGVFSEIVGELDSAMGAAGSLP